MVTPVKLWHYTCDHGLAGIEADGGMIRPGPDGLVWMTDLPFPLRDALGLTSHLLGCDRAAHRYAILPPHPYAVRWLDVRQLPFIAGRVAELESSPGAMPGRWYVAARVVAAKLEPRSKHR